MPFEPGPHDSQLWLPDDARAHVEKDASSPTVMIDNQTDLPDQELMSYFVENTAMFGFGQETRYTQYAAEGTMMARSKWRPPRNVIEEIALSRDMVERDDDVGPVVNTMLAAAFHAGYSNQHEDEQVEHTFQEMSEDIGLNGVLHEMYRELLISSQVNTVTLFTRATYDIRPENVSRLIRRSVAKPVIGVLPAERIRVLGNDLFGGGQLAYLPEGSLAEWLREYWNQTTSAARKREMRLADPVAAALFLGRATVPWNELDLLSTGMNLYLLNPDMVQRSTFAKGSWRYPRPLLTRNLPLLEAKRLLNIMDHAMLQGGINYIVLAKKGDEKKPATPNEIANLQGVVQRASRAGVLVGDHRVSLEIIQPSLEEMLSPERRQMIGRKLAQAMLRVPEFGSDETGMAVQTFTELAQSVITDDRALVLDHLHRHIWRVCMRRNVSVFGRSDRPSVWLPRVILQGMEFWTQYLLKLYDRGDLPRKYVVEFGGYDYASVKAQKQREVASGHDYIFQPPAVPFSSPNQGPGDPFQYGNPAGIPPGPGAPGAPNDNGGGRPRGASTGSGTNSGGDRPSRVIRRTPGETVRASWNEEEQQVVRVGEITERVLAEFPDATLGRVTPAERAALEAGRTTNEGNVIVVPVNVGFQIEDVQAVRLAESFSMLCGNRVHDHAIVAAAFCFREPKVTLHEAEDMVIRWGYPIAVAQAADMPSSGLTCPSCGAGNEMDATACVNCGNDGPPFDIPQAQRRMLNYQQPIALHLTVNGETAQPSAKPAAKPAAKPGAPSTEPVLPPPDPGPPPGWASHETELMFRSLMASKNLWDAALKFASDHRRDSKAIATELQSNIVPREMLQQLATNGWDPTKIDWLQIALQLAQRADHPRPKPDPSGG